MVSMEEEQYEYAGFWIRVGATLIDTLLLMLISVPLLTYTYGWNSFFDSARGLVVGVADFLISYIVPAVALVVFWMYRQATPGKMIVSAKIVDAKTGGPLTVRQSIGRYLGYFVSTIPFGLGLIWVAFDPKKQAWHDKLAGTAVIRTRA